MKIIWLFAAVALLPAATFAQGEHAYCQAWAADPAHISPATTFPNGFNVYCPTWIQFEQKNCNGTFIVNRPQLPCSIPTDAELLAASTEIKRAADVQAENDLARKERQRAQDAQDAARLQARNQAYQALLTSLGIHKGESQAAVKAELQAKGFKMPWTCGGQLIDGTWMAGCIAYRGQEKVTVFFSVWQAVPYINPDTQEQSVVKRKTDQLINVAYDKGD